MRVAVIGAAGHVGFPFSLIVADAGHDVIGIDINHHMCNMLNSGFIPYIEHGAPVVFDRVRNNQKIHFTPDSSQMMDCDVIAIMMGTPVDGEGNPRLDDILDFVSYDLVAHIKPGALIILRSTVSPGTTEIIRKVIAKEASLVEGRDYHLVFCPERVAQSHSIEETKKFPQLIGAFSETSFKIAETFFKTFVDNVCFHLTPREAEVGKLITNMYRYVSFALANEFYMIADKQGVDIHKVINAANHDYGRMAVPLPGPNVGGPCLFKDGKFLLTDIHFSDLIQTSFHINEGMPDYVFNRIKSMNPNLNRILVLGLAFKADCDDTRNSLSYKFMKVCKKNGVDTHAIDPFVVGNNLSPDEIVKSMYDAVVLMTPHKQFKEQHMEWIRGLKNDCIIADVWKSWPVSERFHNGIYTAEDLDY
jgi:UDP-N-acetyl-D-mannosaminuronic acid dehydrogenase